MFLNWNQYLGNNVMDRVLLLLLIIFCSKLRDSIIIWIKVSSCLKNWVFWNLNKFNSYINKLGFQKGIDYKTIYGI